MGINFLCTFAPLSSFLTPFPHMFLYHCHRASSSQTITEAAAAGFCMYVLPCAAGRPGRRRRTRTAEGRTNSPFTPSLTCVLARDTPPPPRRRTSRRRPGFLNLLEVDRNDRLSRHLQIPRIMSARDGGRGRRLERCDHNLSIVERRGGGGSAWRARRKAARLARLLPFGPWPPLARCGVPVPDDLNCRFI